MALMEIHSSLWVKLNQVADIGYLRKVVVQETSCKQQSRLWSLASSVVGRSLPHKTIVYFAIIVTRSCCLSKCWRRHSWVSSQPANIPGIQTFYSTLSMTDLSYSTVSKHTAADWNLLTGSIFWEVIDSVLNWFTSQMNVFRRVLTAWL